MTKPTCQIQGCDSVDGALTRGMCGTHYQRWRRGKRGADFISPIPHRGSELPPELRRYARPKQP